MRKTLVGILAALVCGCAGYNPTPYWTIKDSAFRSLKPGATTKAEVRNLIGTPLLESSFPRQGEDVWDYRYLDGTIVMLAYVHFDSRGVVKYYEQRLDPAYHGAMDM